MEGIGKLILRATVGGYFVGHGLQKLTGETLGYRYYDDESARAPAIARWRAWLAAQKGRVGERYILGNKNMTLKEFLDEGAFPDLDEMLVDSGLG